MRKLVKCLLVLACVSACVAGCKRNNVSQSVTKIGFVVKQPEEPWFQHEWKFAQQAADKDHFELIKIGAPDGAAVMAAIDNLGAQNAGGFVICTPDVRLGPAIVNRAKRYN